MSTGGIDRYYEHLGWWNRLARTIGYGGGRSTLTVHRALADPRADGAETYTRLHDLLCQHVEPGTSPRVLDAGCGLGGTMIDLAARLDATCIGLTLSPSQAREANTAAARRDLGNRVRAIVGSYDEPPDGPFDLIVAIESIAHSPDPARTVRALTRVLAPGGWLAVVDDMPDPSATGDQDLATFQRGWRCPVLWSAEAYRAEFARQALTLIHDVDLTGECRPRSLWRIVLLSAVNRAVHALPSAALRDVMDSHLGGLALERLVRRGRVRYRLLVARRPELQVS